MILIVAIALIVGIVMSMRHRSGSGEEDETETEIETTAVSSEVSVNGVNITGMTKAEAQAAIEAAFPWSMKVTYNEETYELPDLLSPCIDDLLNEIYLADEPEESYTIDFSGMNDAVVGQTSYIASMWDKPATNAAISGYDSDSDRFIFSGGENGVAIDQDLLTAAILDAIQKEDFSATIPVAVGEIAPEISEDTARSKYQTIGTFTTNTTSNSKRNTNVRLACEAVNGTILQPGDEFSFNSTVGQRTEEKGYQEASAYNNGEVVQEIGGGVCQVSSTMYNAVVKAGLKTTSRQSHTFEPSYVTPGTDATVSWGGPDYKFVNNSDSPIGIRASYGSQTCTVSIYGIPVLEEGVTQSLSSEKTKDYTTGSEADRASGLQSTWEVRLVVRKNGEEISRNVDHTSTYKAHTEENDAEAAAAVEAAATAQAEEPETEPETITAIDAPVVEEEIISEGSSTVTQVAPTSSGSSSAVISGGPGSASSGSSSSSSGPGVSQTAAVPVPEATAAQPAPIEQIQQAPAAAEVSGDSGVVSYEGPASSGTELQTIAPMPGG